MMNTNANIMTGALDEGCDLNIVSYHALIGFRPDGCHVFTMFWKQKICCEEECRVKTLDGENGRERERGWSVRKRRMIKGVRGSSGSGLPRQLAHPLDLVRLLT